MAVYESEHTKFMREWLKQHPQQTEEIKKGRALWWDKGVKDIESLRREQQGRVAPKAYYYDAN